MAKGRNNKQATPKTIIFDIGPETIDRLPSTIKMALQTKRVMILFCSMADDSHLELCQIPEVKELYKKACIEYGLLGYLEYQLPLFPRTQEIITDVISIACGSWVSTNGSKFIMKLESEDVKPLWDKSVQKYRELYLK